jgi:uncharacterized membrane protein YvbJ
MMKCEKCSRDVEEGQTLCRRHHAEQQARRTQRIKTVIEWGGKILPVLLLLLPRGKFKK